MTPRHLLSPAVRVAERHGAWLIGAKPSVKLYLRETRP